MEEGLAVTSSSLVDAPAHEIAEVCESASANISEFHGSNLSDDKSGLTDDDEEADEVFHSNREGERLHENFYNAGYGDGIVAGRIDAAQDGFNQGFKDSVMVGYKWGSIRGVTSALAHLPNELKLKLVETEEKRDEFLNLYEAVEAVGTEDALKLFYDDIQQGSSAQRSKTVKSESSITHPSGSEQSYLESYFGKLDLLLKDSPVIDVQLELNK